MKLEKDKKDFFVRNDVHGLGFGSSAVILKCLGGREMLR
jgi:hypothetical protein